MAEKVINDEQCWEAVITRDRESDGNFVFAVRSTGIYCRPSCPARRPRREQVTFFQHATAAETAGFRACLRCHPQNDRPPEPQKETIEQICHYIETNLDAALHLADLGQRFHLSPYHLQRTFKRIKGMTPRQYAESCRLNHFKIQLQNGGTVTDALYDAGYRSSSSMYERAPAQLGMTPTMYQQGGKSMHIGYTIIESPLGYILLAATARGVAAVRFGDSAVTLQAELEGEFPAAQLERDEEGLQPYVTMLLEYLRGRHDLSAMALDIHASAFQWKVWEALRAIPTGSTRSYRDIAQAIGQPTAARAVAQACASNQVAILIPCHRVIRENGQLGGYHWGLERKQQLLALEQRLATVDPHAEQSSLSTID